MEPDGSLPCTQDPASGPYPEPDAPSLRLPTLFPEICSNVILLSTHWSSEWFLPLRSLKYKY